MHYSGKRNKNRSSICTLVRETCLTMKINLWIESTVLHRSRAHRRFFSEINAAFRWKRRRPSFFFERGSGGGGGIDWFFSSVDGIYSGRNIPYFVKLADQTRKTASKRNSKRVLSRFLPSWYLFINSRRRNDHVAQF